MTICVTFLLEQTIREAEEFMRAIEDLKELARRGGVFILEDGTEVSVREALRELYGLEVIR